MVSAPAPPENDRVLVLTGMHRSGTSLLAGMAIQAGIDMGKRLLPAGNGNPRGHFEDLDFVDFHEACLRRRGARPLRPPAGGVPRLGGDEVREARAIFARRAGIPIWGWKDPRTILFLPDWAALLPAAFYLLVYRHPVEVVLSLLRRGHEPELRLDPRLGIAAWLVYNRQLLAFHEQCPERAMLWSIRGATRHLPSALDLLGRRSGLPLAGRGVERLYVPTELGGGLESRRIDWRDLLPEAMALYDRLERAADLPGGDPAAARDRRLMEASEHQLAAALTNGRGPRAAAEAPFRGSASDAPGAGTPLPAGAVAGGAPGAEPESVGHEHERVWQAERIARLEQRVASLGGQLDLLGGASARAEATRSWRLVHAYWGAARRWQGLKRQAGWRLRAGLGRLPPLRPEEIVVGCVAEDKPLLLAQARRMVRSLRWFGGELAGARALVCVTGEIAPGDRRALEAEGAEVRIVEPFDRRNPSSHKLQFFAEALATGARGLLLLDCDQAVVGDPLPLLAAGALQAKIADVPSVTHDAFERLFRHFGLPLPARRYRTTLQGDPTILYCNTGMVFLPRELALELVPVWREWNRRILDCLELLGPCAHHCHQASFSLALAAHPVPFAAAPPALNFPLHLHPQPPPAALLAADPVILHYHSRVDTTGCLLPSPYPRAQARITALNRRLSAAAGSVPLG